MEDITPTTPETPITETPDPATEVQRLTAELDAARQENTQLKADQSAQAQRQSLDGKVTDVNAALKALDPERHLNKDGTVNVSAFLGDFPGLAVQAGPTAPNGAGGPHRTYILEPDLDTLSHTGTAGEINAAFDAALKGAK